TGTAPLAGLQVVALRLDPVIGVPHPPRGFAGVAELQRQPDGIAQGRLLADFKGDRQLAVRQDRDGLPRRVGLGLCARTRPGGKEGGGGREGERVENRGAAWGVWGGTAGRGHATPTRRRGHATSL